MGDVTYPHREAEAALEARVAELREAGTDPIVVAEVTADERRDVLLARSMTFASGTQGRGKPAAYGHGSPEKNRPKGKGKR